MKISSGILITILVLSISLAGMTPVQGSDSIQPEIQTIEPAILGGGQVLELSYVAEFQVVWQDLGCGTEMNGTFWRPIVPEGYYSLGHYGQDNWSEPSGGMFAVRELEAGALAPPVDYEGLWGDWGSDDCTYDGSFWKPIPATGYVCLGIVAQYGYVKPDLNDIRCVREDLVTEGYVSGRLWNDMGSGANYDISTWYINANEDGISVGAFTGWGIYPIPDYPVYVLKSNKVWKETPTQELELVYIDEYELEWYDAGSEADRDGTFWKPVVPDEYYAFGHYGQGSYNPPLGPTFAVRELVPGSGALAAPVDYHLIWMDTGSGAYMNGSFWKPIPPEGYVCLGTVAQNGYEEPGLDEIRCVRQDLACPGKSPAEIWDTQGSSADMPFGSWVITPAQDNAIYLGTFISYMPVTLINWWTDPYELMYPMPRPDILFGLDSRSVLAEVDPLSSAEVDGLIRQYGPKLYLHSEEIYFLDDPEWILDNGINLRWALIATESDYDTFSEQYPDEMPTSSQSLMDDVDYVINNIKPNPPYKDSEQFKIWLEHIAIFSGDLDRTDAYIHVIPWNTFFTEIQFWFFYPYNGPGRVEICLVGDCKQEQLVTNGRHYGDWEHISLRFMNSTQELVAVYMSAHAGGQWFGTGDFGYRLAFDGNHPIVFSAKYSHAHYPTAGTQYYEEIFNIVIGRGTLYDLTDYGYLFETYLPENYKVMSSELYPVQEPDWLQFQGRWGGYEKLATDFGVYTYTEVGAGPSGPNMKYAWNRGDLADFIFWPANPYNVDWSFTHLPMISTGD